LAEMRAEYRREDLGKGIRGNYHGSYQKGTNLVLLSPDVARAFPNDEAVNDALRSLLDQSSKSIRGAKQPTKRSKKPVR